MATKNAVAAAWGREIAARREHYGLSRAQLAEQLGVSRQMVRLWETAEHAPSARMQQDLVGRLGIDPTTLARLIRDGMGGAAA